MTWKLWLDDQLNDPEVPVRHTPEGFVGAKSSANAIKLVEEHGLPFFMDLDHDLGGGDTVMELLRWMQRKYPEGPVPEYRIHTQNVVGEPAIRSFMASWEKSIGLPALYIDDAKLLSEVHGVAIVSVFTIGETEAKKIREFTDAHHKIHKGNDGAIGGRFTYSFTPTSLFTIVTCHCACGEKVDATSYGGF